MKLFSTFLILLLALNVNSQNGLDSLGSLDIPTIHNCELNDIWGYTDEDGNEYAIVGTTKGTSIVDVSDPTNPIEIFWEPGTNSVWRDIKTHQDFAYVTTEANDGLLIIDLSPLPASTSLTTSYYFGEVGEQWSSAHNLYIDENGHAYIFGANRGEGGVIILDVNTSPGLPVEIGMYDDYYVHDGYVRGDTMYLGHINDGFFGIVDVSDVNNPVLLGQNVSPNIFTHNVWASDNGDYLFTTDEVSFGHIGSYDISDPNNIVELDRIQSSPGAGVIPHNAHVDGNFLVTSYYSDGVVVHDITHPYNLVEVGKYDTYPGQTTGYDGCWGVYPFFSSSTVVASDRSEGLFILGSNYNQAAYLEGVITDAVSLNPINQVTVELEGAVWTDYSASNGFYATGLATGGNYNVTYSKVGYFPQTINVNIVNGVITTQDVALDPIPQFPVTIEVLDATTNLPIDGADVRLRGSLTDYFGVTNGVGEELFMLYYTEVYELIVGKWGYVTKCSFEDIDENTGTITVLLNSGFYDDFSFDFGWTETSTAETGDWERGIPLGTLSNSAPSQDLLNDCGLECYVTFNDSVLGSNHGDIDKGEVVLRSPVMDLSSYMEPYIEYYRWFYCFHGPGAFDDSLRIHVSNGTENVLIDIIGSDVATNGTWIKKSIKLSDYLNITSTMQVFFSSSDLVGDDNITEAAIDKFRILEENEVGVGSIDPNENINIYPNPSNSEVFIEGVKVNSKYSLISLEGKSVSSGKLDENRIDLSDLNSGLYFIYINNQILRIEIIR